MVDWRAMKVAERGPLSEEDSEGRRSRNELEQGMVEARRDPRLSSLF